MTHPIVIIGTGMAGYTLARELRKASPEAEIVMVSADDAVNYAKPTLSNALVGNKTPEKIALADAAKMTETLKVTILAHAQVEVIDVTAHMLSIQFHNGVTQQQPYSKLVLAVGADQIRLPIQGDGAQDIYTVNSLIDYQKFREHLDRSRDKRVVLIGAGLIGCEFANDLLATGHSVVLVDLAPFPLGRLLPMKTAQMFQQQLESSGMQFQLATTVQAVFKVDDAYRVELANGESYLVDIVLSAIGLRPNLTLAQATEIATSRGIITNQLLETNQPDIYALGDCAEVEGHLLPYVMPLMQQARALAKTLSGDPTAVHYPAMPVAVKTPAAPLVVLPEPANLDVTWENEILEDGMIARALDAAGQLRGFVLLGAAAGKQRLALAKQVPDLMSVP